ncbi:ATP-binding cassette domain-containing protein [Candidatus Poribacteria bacterium]|nr:ATP-binding cassette domain-containing protein [Candidatus Poribacteria bacterium]
MNDNILVTQNLTIGYAHPRRSSHIVGENISVSIPTGELICLIGPNGVGKSTLIRTIAGLQTPLKGQVKLAGKEVNKLKPRELAKLLSIVLTTRVNAGNMTAYGLVALGRYPYTDWAGKLTRHDEEAIRWAIKSVGAVELAQRNVNELSDGERQKVMIARALAQEPTLIVLDEPTAFLDLPRRVEIMRILRNLARTTGKSILLSTHDLDLALRSADTIWLMSYDKPLRCGAPEDLVLSGAFQDTFQSEGIEFDHQTGSFRIHNLNSGEIVLNGNGIHAFWTKRALEREGYNVLQNPQSISGHKMIEIIKGDSEVKWKMTYNGDTNHYNSLRELISNLRQ